MAANTSLVDVEPLLELVTEIDGQVSKYKGNTQLVADIHNKLLNMPWGQGIREDLATRLSTIDKQNKKIAKNVRDLIKKGDELKVEQESMKQEKLGSAAVWLQNAMMEYNNEQIQYSSKSKEKLVKAIQITGTELTHDQILHRIDSGQISNEIFTESIIQDTAEASRQLEEVHDRHKEMLNLEESLRELSELMEEVKQLVAGQQKKVDHIECDIEDTQANIESAVSFLSRAAKMRGKLRENKTLLWGVISSVIIILVIIIIAATKSKSSPPVPDAPLSPDPVGPSTEPAITPTSLMPIDEGNESEVIPCSQEFPLPCHPACPMAGATTAHCMCGVETCRPTETCKSGVCYQGRYLEK